MFTVDNVQEFLQKQKFITNQSFISGDYIATSANRRNRNVQITTLNEGNYLVKQVLDKNSQNATTLKNEILFYNYLKSFRSDLTSMYPEIKYCDKTNIILVLTFYSNALPLWKYYKKRSINDLPFNTIKKIGKIISMLHIAFSDTKIFCDSNLTFLSKELPFAFNINKPEPKLLSYIRPGGVQFIQSIQSCDDIMTIWDAIEKKWELNSIIHGDIKLDNILVIDNDDNTQNEGSTNIKIIDWEMVQYGDFAWDIAGVLQDFIFWWAISMPNEQSAEDMVKKAGFPISRLKPGIVSFWEAYCNQSKLSKQYKSTLLSKVILYSGLRTLQTAYEISSKFENIPPIAQILTGIGKSILRNPDEAAIHLFGIQE